MDPEKFVDTGLMMRELKDDDVMSTEQEQMKIWTNINTDINCDYYHVEQDWYW